MRSVTHSLGGVLATIWRAIRARPWLFASVALAVVLLDVFLPVVVLSVFRKPYDHFSFNPWLAHAPQWALSPTIALARKVQFLSEVALFWFIASGAYDEAEWGFSVGMHDAARFVYMGLVFGAYFALWAYARGTGSAVRMSWRGGATGGYTGAALSTLGLVTSPCSVAGCGAPILPVLGLTLQGVTSGTLAAVASLSQIASEVVLIGMTLAVVVLAWVIDRRQRPGSPPVAARPLEGQHASGAAG